MSYRKQSSAHNIVLQDTPRYTYGLTHISQILQYFRMQLPNDGCSYLGTTTLLLLLYYAIFTATGSAIWTHTARQQLAGYDATRGAGHYNIIL